LSNPVHVRCGKGSRGSDPRLLRPNNGLATRPHIGERPRASRIVRALGLDQPSINTIAQQDRQLKPRDPYGLGASTCTAFRAAGLWRWEFARSLYPNERTFRPCGYVRDAELFKDHARGPVCFKVCASTKVRLGRGVSPLNPGVAAVGTGPILRAVENDRRGPAFRSTEPCQRLWLARAVETGRG
jgi:hypothetical protein